MSISLKKSGMLKLGLSLVAMTVAASVQAKTLVYCSEGSPEGFNPQLFTSGTTYDASSVPIYNRLVEFKPVPRKLFQGLLRNGKSVLMAKPILSICARA
ncbi:periplasmic dipeptide transport protein [Klebsiella variicola]|nr:periplasmic dipeptide transport protein [Klebsiella variicola]